MGIRTHRGGDVAEARPFVFVDKRCGPGGGGGRRGRSVPRWRRRGRPLATLDGLRGGAGVLTWPGFI